MRILCGLAAAIIAAFGLRELAWLLNPVLLAALVVTLVHPVYGRLRARGVGAPLSLAALTVAVYGSIAAVAALILYALARFASILPRYSAQFEALIRGFRDALTQAGIGRPQTDELLTWIDLPTAARWLTAQLPSIVGFAFTAILLGTVLIFLTIESTQLADRTRTLRADHPRIVDALRLSAVRTRRFFVVTTIFAVIVGVLDTGLLLLLGVPFAPLWGMLAAVCNYIPYLGFWVGMIPPAVLGLTLHGWETALIIVIGYVVLNFVVTSLLPTKFIGDAVGLSMTAEVVAIALGVWILGPIGAILAVPLTIAIKGVVVDADPRASWAGELLSSGKALRRAG